MPFTSGQVINNRYRIARLLGQGGMGAVYRAWDLNLNIPVALKEMIPQPGLDSHSLAELRAQFQREARVLASISHPNLPRVSDYFEWGGNAYLVMDFVEGENLEQLISRQGQLPEAQVVAWAGQLLDALATCHARGIIHRDVKPQNIIIRPNGQAVLVDFGLVKMWDPRHPQTQYIVRGMGTREYASPEHFHLSGHHTEPRSDLYSLGATLFHALTGQEPPSAIERTTDSLSCSLQNLERYAHPHVGEAIRRAMSLDLNQRFATATEMRAALQCPVGRPSALPAVAPLNTTRPPSATLSLPIPLAVTNPGRWKQEMLVGAGIALIGTLTIPLVLYPASMTVDFYIGRSLFALFLGALGWFAGDLIFQALARPEAAAAAASAGRPTQRLVALTRRMARRLTTWQQLLLLIASLAVILPLVALFGPLLSRSAFFVNYVPSYAPVGPLAWAAVGRRPGRTFVAHTLVTTLSMIALGEAEHAGMVFLASAIGGLLMEGFAFLMERALLRRP